jgi:chromosome segregation ATPase
MKIRCIELVNFRRIVGPVRVNGMTDNLNILVVGNELGKATLLEAANAVIFERARSNSQRVRGFRQYLDGAVPEVTLEFELQGVRWIVNKRFAGTAGRAILIGPDEQHFEDDEAERELERLFAFAGEVTGAEPSIGGILAVREDPSYNDDLQLEDMARRSLRECVEAQVARIAGGVRGNKISGAVTAALEEIRGGLSGPGRWKLCIDELVQIDATMADLEAKRAQQVQDADDLVLLRGELEALLASWDDEGLQRDLTALREKRGAAAEFASELEAALNAAKVAAERAERAQYLHRERDDLHHEVDSLESRVSSLRTEIEQLEGESGDARSNVDSQESALIDLRERSRVSGEALRRLEQTRGVVQLRETLTKHEDALKRAMYLDAEAKEVQRCIGEIVATDTTSRRLQDALAEVSEAEAALSSVATEIKWSLDSRRVRINQDAKGLTGSIDITEKTIFGIEGVGTLTIEPRIPNRDAMIQRIARAKSFLNGALQKTGAALFDQSNALNAHRKDLETRLWEIGVEIKRLLVEDDGSGRPPGLEALEDHVDDLRDKLEDEMAQLKIESLPELGAIETELAQIKKENAEISYAIQQAEAAILEPRQMIEGAVSRLQELQASLAELSAPLESKRMELAAGRAIVTDEQLDTEARALSEEYAEKQAKVVTLEMGSGESLDIIDAQIQELEERAAEHQRSVARLNTDIARLMAVIEASQTDGVEELLEAARARHAHLQEIAAKLSDEAAVLELLSDTLATTAQDTNGWLLEPAVARVESYLRMLLPSAELMFDRQLQAGDITFGELQTEFAQLGGGLQEYIAVFSRIAVADLLTAEGRPAAVILDDTMTFAEDRPLEPMFDVLLRASEYVQIIVLTRRLLPDFGATTLFVEEFEPMTEAVEYS